MLTNAPIPNLPPEFAVQPSARSSVCHGHPGRASYRLVGILLLSLLLLPTPARAGWGDGAWPYRRAVDVEWTDKMKGDELAEVDIYTAGKHEPSGDAVRVMTDENKLVPARVLMVGPGDKIRVLFAPAKGVRRHWVYFGCPKPPPPPRNVAELPIRSGVLMEMNKLQGPPASDAKQLEASWNQSTKPVGKTLTHSLYIGFNPFNDDSNTIARYTATLNVPLDGPYSFAGSAGDRGAIFIDGKPLMFIPGQTHEIRQTAKIELKRGPHDLVFYQQTQSGNPRLSVVWKRPDSEKFDVLGPAAFGSIARAIPAGLEGKGEALTADMKIEYLGECFFADHYSHRYRFTAQVASIATRTAPITTTWDFGDGQSATGPAVEHVFLTDADYPIKISAKFGQSSDSKSTRLSVSRLYEHIDGPPGDMPSVHAKILAAYDLSAIPVNWLPWASQLFERSKDHPLLEKVAVRLAAIPQGVDPGFGMNTLASAAFELASAGKFDSAARIWEAVPAASPFHPFAAQKYGELLIWRLADFPKAAKVLEPFAKKHADNRALQRLYAYSLILGGKSADGIKILKSVPGDGPADRQSALTGADARTIEFYITQSDWETGENIWEKWAHQYPADFLEGYSVMLRTRLMELAKAPDSAAKVAEAFALALPKSSYSPRLLDRASKLLEKLDPAKSKALRATLKQKYPEDPLSQDQGTVNP